MYGITGSNGMSGLHLKALLEKQNIAYKEVGRELWDLRNWPTSQDFDFLFGDCSAVFHFGASIPSGASNINSVEFQEAELLFNANVRSVFALGNWALLRGKALVFLSGSTVYKDCDKPKIDENSSKVTNGLGGFYGYSKLLAEQCLYHLIDRGLRCVILRPSSIYGTGMPLNRLLSSFVSAAISNDTLSIHHPLQNRINLVHSADVVSAAWNALRAEAWGIYNIAGPKLLRYLDIAQCVIAAAGSGQISISKGHLQSNPFSRFDLSTKLAFESFGFRPQIDLYTGIQALINNQLIAVE